MVGSADEERTTQIVSGETSSSNAYVINNSEAIKQIFLSTEGYLCYLEKVAESMYYMNNIDRGEEEEACKVGLEYIDRTMEVLGVKEIYRLPITRYVEKLEELKFIKSSSTFMVTDFTVNCTCSYDHLLGLLKSRYLAQNEAAKTELLYDLKAKIDLCSVEVEKDKESIERTLKYINLMSYEAREATRGFSIDPIRDTLGEDPLPFTKDVFLKLKAIKDVTESFIV